MSKLCSYTSYPQREVNPEQAPATSGRSGRGQDRKTVAAPACRNAEGRGFTSIGEARAFPNHNDEEIIEAPHKDLLNHPCSFGNFIPGLRRGAGNLMVETVHPLLRTAGNGATTVETSGHPPHSVLQ